MLARHENRTRRTADGVAGIVRRELHSFFTEVIDVGSFELFLPVDREITVAEIVRKNVNDVGLVLGKQCRGEEEKEKAFHECERWIRSGSKEASKSEGFSNGSTFLIPLLRVIFPENGFFHHEMIWKPILKISLTFTVVVLLVLPYIVPAFGILPKLNSTSVVFGFA